MATNEELEQAIEDRVQEGVQSATYDGETVTADNIKDLIEGKKFLNDQERAKAGPMFRVSRIRHSGPTGNP